MLPEYSGLCGITKTELETTLIPNVAELAERLMCTVDEAYAMLKEYYDGYHFCEDAEDVYAPYSLLNALSDGNIKEYWFVSGTHSSLMENLKHYPLSTSFTYDGVDVPLDEFDIPCEEATTPMPLLYQSGYLSIDRYNQDTDTYTLRFPNKEVLNGLIKNLMPLIMRRTPSDSNALVTNMTKSILAGDISSALAQIEDKGYAVPWLADGRKVTKCGVRIDSQHRNITHWRIQDENGSTLEDKIFE